MYFKQKRLSVAFYCAFAVLLVLTNIVASEVTAQNAVDDATLETASYQGLQAGNFMRTWLILGPIPVSDSETKPDEDTQKKAFAIDIPVEARSHPVTGSTHQTKDNEYTWQLVQSENDIVDLIEVYGQKDFVIAYAWAEIDVLESTTVLLGIGSDDGVKVWLNGKLVHENWIGRPVKEDDDIVPVTFQKGKNQLLLKIQNGILDWGFACRKLGAESLTEKLIEAAGIGNLDDLEMLLSHGADVNATIEPGLTALHVAKVKGKVDTEKFLLEKGADPNIEMPPKETIVDAVFNEVIKGDSSGAAVLIAQNGEILYEKGFGFANLEHHVPITSETKFRIGSITKQFTATAILKLQEEGKLSVEDKLSKFIPDYLRGDEVTIHHLLTHISGIHSYTGKPDFLDTVTVEVKKPEDLIETFKDDKFDFDPGEKWLYNNSGYFLLGYIVEKVSGESFADYLKNHLFEPPSMENTGIHHWKPILEHEATGYSYEGGKFHKALNWDMSRAGGAGALYSTVGDLYLWNEAVFNGKVLSESSLASAFTPVTLNDGSKADAMGGEYGYGWMISAKRGMKEIGHGGGLHGWSAYLTRYPEHNFTAAILSNCLPPPPGFAPSEIANDIAELYLWKKMESSESFALDTTVDSSIYDDYVGRYDYTQAILTVTREGDKLFAQLSGQPKFELFPKSETEFFLKVVDAQIIFVKNEDGEVTHVIHHQGGRKIEAPRLKDEPPAEVEPAVYDAYVGEYDYGSGRILTVTKEDNRLFAQMTGQPKIEIFPKSETEFFWKIVNAQIEFVKDDEGKVIKAIHHQAGMEIEAPKIK